MREAWRAIARSMAVSLLVFFGVIVVCVLLGYITFTCLYDPPRLFVSLVLDYRRRILYFHISSDPVAFTLFVRRLPFTPFISLPLGTFAIS